MNFDFSSLSTLLGFAGAIGGIVGFLSYGRAKTIIELQQAEIKAREERFTTLSDQFTDCKAAASAAEAKAKVLEGLVTQTPSIEKLATAQSQQHKEVITALAGVTEQLSNLVKAMSDNQERERKRGSRTPKKSA